MKPLDQNLLRPNQIDELKRTQDDLQSAIYGRPGADGQMPGYRSAVPGDVRAQLSRVNKMLSDQSPEPLTGDEQDKASKLERELRTEITQGMLSGEEMRKNPATAVDRHMKWEKYNKAKILRWKNLRLQLNAGSEERDIANLEQYRPEHSGHRIMTDAQIPGLHAMSEQAKQNWPLGDPKCDTAVAQNQRVRKQLSEEDKQKARTNLANARAKKLAAKASAVVAEGVS